MERPAPVSRLLRLLLTALPLAALAIALVLVPRWLGVLESEPPAWDPPQVEVQIAPPASGLGELALEGRLVEASGQPASGISLVTVQGDRVRRALSGSDGRFRLERLVQGEATLYAVGISRLPESFQVEIPAEAVELQLGGGVVRPSPLPELELADLTVEVLLPASDAAGAEGLRLALVPLGGPGRAPRVPRLVELGAGLQVTLEGLPLGSWEAQLLPPGSTLGQPWDLLRPYGEPAVVLTHDGTAAVQLVARHGQLEGTLTGPEGLPAAGALVVIGPPEEGTPPFAAVSTDAAGRWSVGRVPAGTWRVDWRDGQRGGRAEVTVERGARVEVRPDAYD